MVRLKHRYLLINILYPEDSEPQQHQLQRPSAKAAPKRNDSAGADAGADAIPETVQFRRPSSDKLTPQLLARVIRDGVAELFGDYGGGVVAGSLVVKYLSPATSTAIIRVTRAHYRLVWAALTFVTRFPRPVDQTCVCQVVRVSGTIRKAEEEAVRRARATILRATARGKGADVVLSGILGDGDARRGDKGKMRGIVSDDEEDDDDDEMDED